MKTIAIIGGGAAGLMAAVTAARQGAAVTVYDRNAEAGKKILASGNGRCNIVNTDTTVNDYDGSDPAFVRHALEAMPFKVFERFCLGIGLLLDVRDDGRCYPLSNEAGAVQAAFVRAAKAEGVRFVQNSTVTGIEKEGESFIVHGGDEAERYDRIVLCTGSPAAPQLGGSESGLRLAEAFGHTVVPPFPALVGLHLDAPFLDRTFGVKCDARLTLNVGGHDTAVTEGDLLFTRYGVSGFAVLDLSYAASEALSAFEPVQLTIELLPGMNAQSLTAKIRQLAEGLNDAPLHELLRGLLPHKLIRPLLGTAKVPPELPCSRLGPKQAKGIVHTLKHWKFTVTDTHGYKHAEVAGGGVDTAEVDPKTMESRLVPGLHFAGEMLDVTGHRGGYNFHFAWGSGYLAGKAAIS
jgi:predicted Rossmann fold flavoprotein